VSTPTTHLRSVGDGEAPQLIVSTSEVSGLPDFEGQPVDFTRVKLSSVSKLEAGEQFSRIDDTVRMFVEGRVVRVDHVVDELTGKLMRVHTVKVVDAIQLPWDFDAGQLDD
jgi:hypothetical protein